PGRRAAPHLPHAVAHPPRLAPARLEPSARARDRGQGRLRDRERVPQGLQAGDGGGAERMAAREAVPSSGRGLARNQLVSRPGRGVWRDRTAKVRQDYLSRSVKISYWTCVFWALPVTSRLPNGSTVASETSSPGV